MSERDAEPADEALPEALVEPTRGLSMIWLVPLVAVAIAGSLLYQDLRERGKQVEVSLPTAEGVEAGKTQVRYRDGVVGTVQTVRLSDDLSHIVIVAQMARDADPVLVDIDGDGQVEIIKSVDNYAGDAPQLPGRKSVSFES